MMQADMDRTRAHQERGSARGDEAVSREVEE
jgi:hypothetical protein